MSEYINSFIVGGVLVGLLLGTAWGCSEFLEYQNLDEYFSSNGVYDFSDTEFLVMEDISLCGTTYQTGSIIQKDLYNRCINN
jgi:hypothetical protein